MLTAEAFEKFYGDDAVTQFEIAKAAITRAGALWDTATLSLETTFDGKPCILVSATDANGDIFDWAEPVPGGL